jgi:putative spermidine/putrescine transport system substrate-binding protein
MYSLYEALDRLLKNSKIQQKLLLTSMCFAAALPPVLWAEDTAREQSLVVRHSSAIHLQALKSQLQDFPNTVFIEAQLRPDGADLPVGDVIDIDSATAHKACDAGELFLLPVSQLPAALDLSSVREDYLPDTLLPCAVGHTISSSVIVHRPVTGETPPAILGDFFDTSTFPGPRALTRSVRAVAERALLANGIDAEQLYPTLEQPARAWPIIQHALDSLRGHIYWVEDDTMAIRAMKSQQARFAIVSGHSAVRHAATGGGADWDIIWNQALYQLHMWAIPASTGNQVEAWSLIQQMSTPQINGRYSTSAGNGPVRRSAMSLVGASYQPLLPGSNNTDDLVLRNDQWWENHQQHYQALFEDWLQAQPADSATLNGLANPIAHWQPVPGLR